MAETVFFSWQIDRPTNTGRNFIERALERALARINDEIHIDEAERDELAVDRDTRGVAGQPPIVDTIFKKIDAATVFVPDLTFVGLRNDNRPSPNPNVLIEYGWALKALGHNRIVAVMNVAFGEPTSESMPFDMKHLRFPITYTLSEDASDTEKRNELERLAKTLRDALSAVMATEGSRSRAAASAEKFIPVEPVGTSSRFRALGIPIGISVSGSPFDEDAHDIFLESGPAIWLRVIPVLSQNRRWSALDLEKAGWGGKFLLSPFLNSYGSFSSLRADDGYGTYVAGAGSTTQNVTFAFETREIWGIQAGLISRIADHAKSGTKAGLPIFEPQLRSALARYTELLDVIGAKRPYRWIAGIEGIKGFGLYYPPPKDHHFRSPGPFGTCASQSICEEGPVFEGDAISKSLTPFFAKIFEKFGIERPEYLDDIEQT